MTKRKSPTERYRAQTLERFQLFRASADFTNLRAEGLQALDMVAPCRLEEWPSVLQDAWSKWEEPAYEGFRAGCNRAAAGADLNPWTVEIACLVRDYDPIQQPFPLGSHWPRFSAVTASDDHHFLAHLAWWLRCVGIRYGFEATIVREVEGEMRPQIVPGSLVRRPHGRLLPERRPAMIAALRRGVEVWIQAEAVNTSVGNDES